MRSVAVNFIFNALSVTRATFFEFMENFAKTAVIHEEIFCAVCLPKNYEHSSRADLSFVLELKK